MRFRSWKREGPPLSSRTTAKGPPAAARVVPAGGARAPRPGRCGGHVGGRAGPPCAEGPAVRGARHPRPARGATGVGRGGAAGAVRLPEPLARGWRGRRPGLELPPPREPRPGDVMGGRYKISASGPGERQCSRAGRCGAVSVHGPGHGGRRNPRAQRTARRQRSRPGENRRGATLPGAEGRAPGDVGRGARRGHEWCSERGGRGAPPAAAGRRGPLTRAAARRGGAPPAPRGAGRRMGKERGAARHGACRFSLRSAASSSWKS